MLYNVVLLNKTQSINYKINIIYTIM